ncbi:hypothetical protein V8B97DRAFT_2059888 [Scleroderma yunnanense]
MIHSRLSEPLSVFLFTMHFDSEFFSSCVDVARQECTGSPVYPTTTAVDDFDLTEAKGVPEDILPQSPLISDSYPEAFSDFYGFPSNPISIYRTGDAWPVPKGPEVQRVPREPRPICNHPIRAVWRTLCEQVYKFLNSLEVKWSTIDPVRFAEEEKEAGPPYLWVGVEPRSLSLEGAKAAAVGCKRILANAQFPDVEIAFRESIFTRSTGPQLLNPILFVDSIADIRSPFTPTLGVQIAPRATSHFEGTGALYLCEGGKSNQVFLLTARHVVLPLSAHSYSDALEAMMGKIGRELVFVDQCKNVLAELGEAVEGEDTTVADACQRFEGQLTKVEKITTAVDKFRGEITKHWNTNGFKGNVICLGNKISVPDFVLKMHPHPEGCSSFKYPGNVKEDEICQPTQLDANGEECLIIIKNGKGTGVTIGCGTGIEPFVREYDEYGIKSMSMDVAIHPYSHEDGAFSAPRDLGSIVGDGLRCIVGLVTGNTGMTDSTDVTYLMPYFWVKEHIKQAFPNSYLYLVVV